MLDLDIILDLEFVSWDFRFVFREANYFYLSQLESTLALPCLLISCTCFMKNCSVKSGFAITSLEGIYR